MVERKVDGEAPKPVIEITSQYSLENLRQVAICEECDGNLVPMYSEHKDDSQPEFMVHAGKVPIYKCEGCKFEWFPPQVLLDLAQKTKKAFKDRGLIPGWVFTNWEEQLEESVRDSPPLRSFPAA